MKERIGDNFMSNQPNYFHKILISWFRHCATIVKPCGKEISEVIAYLKDSYDTEPLSHEQLNIYARQLVNEYNSNFAHASNIEALAKLDINESDMALTITNMNNVRNRNHNFEYISEGALSIQGCRIPMTKRNIKRFDALATPIGKYTRLSNRAYSSESYCYVCWDETLPYIFCTGNGQFEVDEDLRYYRGVTMEDINNLTYKFIRFVQLFPRGNYMISLEQFTDDMDMCKKYGFYNNQRLFTEMLDKLNVKYEFLGELSAIPIKQKWFKLFVPQYLHEHSEEHLLISNNGAYGYLWHVFSYEKLDCLEWNNARMAFDTRHKNECIVFFTGNDYAFKLLNAGNLDAKTLESFREIYVIDVNFAWTYINTHDPACGPYFYEAAKASSNSTTTTCQPASPA